MKCVYTGRRGKTDREKERGGEKRRERKRDREREREREKEEQKRMRNKEKREKEKKSCNGGNHIKHFNMERPLVHISLVDVLPGLHHG